MSVDMWVSHVYMTEPKKKGKKKDSTKISVGHM